MEEIEVLLAVDSSDINNLVGRMLTVVDASISDQEQRKALKDIVKQNVWSWSEQVPRRCLSESAKYIADMSVSLEGKTVRGSSG